MKIKELLKDTKYEVLKGNEDIEISHIAYNSKKVKKGSLFVCIQGLKADGHNFINDAFKNGNEPSKSLNLVGITGTNGKTSRIDLNI